MAGFTVAGLHVRERLDGWDYTPGALRDEESVAHWVDLEDTDEPLPPDGLANCLNPPDPLFDDITRPPTWMRQARCVDRHDVDMTRDKQASDTKRAICSRCVVRQDCLHFAVTNTIRVGMWGGLTPAERHILSPAAARRGFVYCGVNDDALKVGFSATPQERCRIQGLSLVKAVPGTMADEYRVHAELHRLLDIDGSGEWYALDDTELIVAVVDRLTVDIEVAA